MTLPDFRQARRRVPTNGSGRSGMFVTQRCWLELRLDVNRDTMRTAVARTADEVQAASADADAMLAKGWIE